MRVRFMLSVRGSPPESGTTSASANWVKLG